MKKNLELSVASVIAGISGILLLGACLLVLNAVPYSSLPAWGIWLVGLSLATGFVSMLYARHYGVLVGAVVPGLLFMVLALHWSQAGGEAKRCVALAMACGGFWVFLWISSQMLASAFRSCLGMGAGKSVFTSAAVLLLLSKVLSFFAMRHGAQGYRALEIVLAAWLAALLVWRPSLTLRTLGLVLSHSLYRIRVDRIDNYPDAGPVMLVANHISFLDFIFILCLKPRRVTFMVDEAFYRFPGLHLFFRWSRALEVPRRMNRAKMRRLIEQTHAVLNRGGAVCVFPEGAISPNGITHAFRSGLWRLMPSRDIPVIPVRLGLHWGSLLTIYDGKLRFIKPRLLPIPGTIIVGEPIPPDWNGFRIWQRIQELGAEAEMKPVRGEKTVHYRYLRRSLQHPFESTFKDADAPKELSNFAMLAQSIIISRKLRMVLADRGDDGQFVGVLLPNKAVSVAVLLGVMFADRTPAILNYTAGDAVMQSMYDRAKLKTVITSRLFLSRLKKPVRDEMIFLEDLPKLVTKGDKLLTAAQIVFLPHQLLIRVVSPRYGTDLMHPAALLFSSGSTGMPKGILLSHHNITANIWSFWRQLNWLYGTERILGNLPLFHAFGLMVGLCFPGVTGTKVTLVANPLDGPGVCKAVRDDKVTMLISTPTFLQTYMRCCKPGDFDSLRMMVTGAEKLQKRLADSFRELTGLSIIEGYGCTEMSPIVSLNLPKDFLAVGREAGPEGSIGVAMPGIAARIVDVDSGKLLEAGKEGLLQLKSASVMLGYLDDPDATAAAMTPDGWYNTNDVASMDRDGYIRITGRLSRFSKIGGEMVPHELIENRLEEFYGIEGKVAVAARPDSRKGEQLVVFYAADCGLDPVDAGNRLRESGLPNLWVPRPDCFFPLEKIPFLGNGKKDLKKLRELAAEAGR
jgi:acyl-[acyl-carrier-protein]-phospholipid O-acyltransferase/long-chain-fatty-acid--[acyl-carrier-protein] ligase